MNTPITLPVHPSGSIAALLLAAACAVAACDPGSLGASPAGPTLEMRDLAQHPLSAPAAAAHRPATAVAAYVGDEYADAQRALRDRPDEPASPTF